MKVLLVNGSPNADGCTFTALKEVEKSLIEDGIETEIFQIGKKPISGCIDCNVCASSGKCVFDDLVNEFVEKAKSCDGFIFGSPVYYAGANGSITSLLDRVFHSNKKSDVFYLKPAAAVVSARRGGTTAALDQLNKYFLISQMPVIASQYWNMVHGNTPQEVKQDLEGLQIMRTLGKNM
ncbi:MAG: flavodoxin family protein, partial [Oscillospiraceae bacterium]